MKKPKQNTGMVSGYVRKSNLVWPEGCTTPEQRAAHVDELRRVRMAELVSDAQRDGLTIDLWYDDMGVSGRGEFLEKRIQFDQLRRDAVSGKVRRVYARDLSRLFRDLVQQELWFGEMEAAGVSVAIQDLPFIPDPGTSTLLRQMLGSINQHMARRTGEIIRATHRERIAAGKWVGRSFSVWGLAYNPETKAFDFDPDTADKPLYVFETFLACGAVATLTATTMNRAFLTGQPRATLSPRGRPWRANTVLQVIRLPLWRREARFGEFVRAAPDMIPEVVPPDMVAEALQMYARRAPQREQNQWGGDNPPHWRLGGRWDNQDGGPMFGSDGVSNLPKPGRPSANYGPLLRCAFCGGRMRAMRSNDRGDGARRVSWFCRRADWKRADCPHSSGFTQVRLDALVGRALAEAFSSAPGFPKGEGDRQKRGAPAKPDKNSFGAALSRVREKQARLYELFAAGLIETIDDLRPQLAPLAAERQRLEDAIREAAGGEGADVTEPPSMPKLTDAQWHALRTRFEDTWNEPSEDVLPPQKRELLLALGVTVRAASDTDGCPPTCRRVAATDPHTGHPLSASGRRVSRFGGPLTAEVQSVALGCVGGAALIVTETPEEYEEARRRRFVRSPRAGRGLGPDKRGVEPDKRQDGC